jgi:hypothetical protein
VGSRVKDFPLQTLPLFTEINGKAFTVILLVAVFTLIQPAVLVPVTV